MHKISYILIVVVALIMLYTAYYGCNCYTKEGFENESNHNKENSVSQLNMVEKKMTENVDKIKTIGKQNQDLLEKMYADTKNMRQSLIDIDTKYV